MQEKKVEVAVIGAGTAGLAAWRAAHAAGKHAVLIEGGAWGTTCARVGCMPSKLLIAAAEAAHQAEQAAVFGVSLPGGVQVDGRAVMERVRRERDRFVGFVTESMLAIPAEDRLQGNARFIDNKVLEVSGIGRIRAGRIVIATGALPFVPPAFAALGDRLLINDDVFDWQNLPKRVAVFGPGVIGLEMGQALHRLGVQVRVFGVRGGIGPLTDPAVRDAAFAAFSAEFALDPDANVTRMQRVGDVVQIGYLNSQGEERVAEFDYVLAAVGRKPNVASLGLENTSLQRGRDGVPLFDPATLQCGSAPIFIAGDANNDRPLLHEAADEGKIAGENAAAWPLVQAGHRRTPISIVFTDPQIMMVGQRFADVQPDAVLIGEVSFADQGRSRVMLQNRGLLRLYVARDSGMLLGAEMVGPRAEHLAHLLAWSVQQQLTVMQMLAMPFYHPVIEEGLRTALRDAQAKLVIQN